MYAVILFIMGTLFPPLGMYLCNLVVNDAIVEWSADHHLNAAVAARFGIGKDFWLNLLLTICGYIPGMCCDYDSLILFK